MYSAATPDDCPSPKNEIPRWMCTFELMSVKIIAVSFNPLLVTHSQDFLSFFYFKQWPPPFHQPLIKHRNYFHSAVALVVWDVLRSAKPLKFGAFWHFIQWQ